MKILHIEAGRHLYGGARQVALLVDALAANGVENRLLCPPGHPLIGLMKAAETIGTPLGGDLDFAQLGRLRHSIAEFAPDIVHVHSRRGADLFAGLAAAAAGVPAVLTRRVQSNEPRAWLRFKCRPYRMIVAISSIVEAELEAAGIGPARTCRIASAVDTSRFLPDAGARSRLLQRFGLPDDAFIAGCAAQFVPRKGQDMLLPLVRRVLARRPGLQLLLFGRGRTRPALERRVAELGIGHAVRFGGYVEDWPQLLPGLDLLLHPARREGLGVVILEAMAAGVPVLAARSGGIVDLIDSGSHGRLAEADDVGEWETALLELIDDSAVRSRFAAAARDRVAAEFSVARMAAQYLDLYRNILR